MHNSAIGNKFCIATPHYKSSMLGILGYLSSRNAAFSILKSEMSLTYNLPHLCGLGGDSIILEKYNGKFRSYNGTGKTGAYQNYDSYKSKGLTKIPRCGVYSTMVYGCPDAYDKFSKINNIDVHNLLFGMIMDDIEYGIIRLPSLIKSFINAKNEINSTTRFSDWSKFFSENCDPGELYKNTLRMISKDGFSSLYSGDLGGIIYSEINSADSNLYSEKDFLEFTPNHSETKRINFLNSKITVHGANSPWREFFILLKIYECFSIDGFAPDPESICTAAGMIDQTISSIDTSSENYAEIIFNKARHIYDEIKFSKICPIAQTNRQSHTVFIACAESSGHLIGITNSIFTPLGSLFEIAGTGIILSNRGFSFNEINSEYRFKSKESVKHTNNCVIVETDDIEFIIGTSGGSVQSQTLAFVINKIIAQNISPHQAVYHPRYANMGVHPKTNNLTYLNESTCTSDIFINTNDLSDKLGVVQLAGINKKTNEIFSVADPRGNGAAIGL